MEGGGWLGTDDSKRLTVFYHRNCPDGITGAWAVFTALPAPTRAALRSLGGLFAAGGGPPSAAAQARVGPLFLWATAGESPRRRQISGRRVVYIDVTPPARVLRWLAEEAASLTVLDHHSGAAERLAELRRSHPAVEVAFDEARSGAQIAWDWARGVSPRPAVVDYVADRDLYKHRLPNSHEVSLALYAEGHTRGFGALEGLRAWAPSRRFRARGALYGRLEARLVEQAVAAGRWGFVRCRAAAGAAPVAYRVIAVNAPMLQTEIGAALLRGAPPSVDFALMWHVAPGCGEIWVSVRASRPGVDLARVAASVVGARPGSGHAQAAGFVVPGADITAVLTPEWRPPRQPKPAPWPGAGRPKIEPRGSAAMTTAELNQALLERLSEHDEISFSEYFTEYGRRTRDQLFPRADRLQELAQQPGYHISEAAFADFDVGAPVPALIAEAGLAEGKDFTRRESGERVLTSRAFRRCLLSASGSDWAIGYYLCLEEAAAGYGSLLQARLRRARDGAARRSPQADERARGPIGPEPAPASAGGAPPGPWTGPGSALKSPQLGARVPGFRQFPAVLGQPGTQELGGSETGRPAGSGRTPRGAGSKRRASRAIARPGRASAPKPSSQVPESPARCPPGPVAHQGGQRASAGDPGDLGPPGGAAA